MKKNLLFGLLFIISGLLLVFASPASGFDATIDQTPSGCSGSACDVETVSGYNIYKMTIDNGEGEVPRYECCKQECPPSYKGCKSGTVPD